MLSLNKRQSRLLFTLSIGVLIVIAGGLLIIRIRHATKLNFFSDSATANGQDKQLFADAPTLTDALVKAKVFNQYLAVLNEAKPASAIDLQTYLIPTDSVMQALDPARLLDLKANPAHALSFIQSLSSKTLQTQASLRGQASFTPLSGNSYKITTDSAGLSIGGAHLVESDIPTSSGLVQVIDAIPNPS